jgi:di/tricarboxylate transporter
MTAEIAIVLGLLLFAVVVFAMEWLPVDAIALSLVVVLVITGILTPDEAFSGFANEMVMILASVFVLSGAMVKAGVMETVSRLIETFGGVSNRRGLGALLAISAAMSSFLSNTVATAIMLPSVIQIARNAGIGPGKLLMPVAYASILGGTCTLIGTSTNLAGSAMAVQLGLQPFAMFEFTGLGVILALAGVLWLVFFGGHMMQDRAPAEPQSQQDDQEFLSRLVVPAGSRAEDLRVRDLDLEASGVKLISILRGEERMKPHILRKVRAGDRLMVKAHRAKLLKAMAELGVEMDADQPNEPSPVNDDASILAEAIVMPQSILVGRSLQQLEFHRRFGTSVVAVHRPTGSRASDLAALRFKVGDVLLLQGTRSSLERLRGNTNLWGLIEVEDRVIPQRDGLLISGLVALALLLSVTGVLQLSIGLLSAVLIITVLRIVRIEEVYRFIEWRLLILIAGMTAFGAAMIKTGAAELMANEIVALTLPYGVTASMAAFALLTILLTQPMSNAAAALTVLPVAIASAELLGVDARSLAILVTLSASLSFITPFEPACLLVYGTGRYRFRDFIWAGLPLTAITLVLLLILVPVFWTF